MISRRTGAIAAALGLLLSFGFIGRAAGAAEKTPRADAPALNTRFRDKLAAVKKERGAAKAKAPRLNAQAKPERERDFAARATSSDAASKDARPSKGPAAVTLHGPRKVTVSPAADKARGVPFEGRHGTGLGDINEEEPNDSSAQILDDLPVNVVGYINPDNDVDYYAITAEQGESIRIEVIADRIFGSQLDSYLEVLGEDTGDGNPVLASNDNFFDNSNDSFIRFVAPDAGENLYIIGVSDSAFLGGSDFGYILNVTVADSPDESEVEPNDTTGNADILSVPTVVFGNSDEANDYDVFTFQANGNQTLVVDVDAEVFASDMDPVVELYDDRGGFLFGVDDTDGADPRFNLVLPYSGTYYLQVYDRDLIGGSTYYYSMNVSLQSAVGSPTVSAFKVIVGGSTGQLLKQVRGTGYTSSNGGSAVEIDGVEVPSRPAPVSPTTRIKVKPGQPVDHGQSVTVVNPDGRRSNPGIVS